MTVHRIKLKDLSLQFIQNLQSANKAEEAEVVLHIHPEAGVEVLSEDSFWEMIRLLDWSKEGDDEAVIEPLVEHLTSLPVGMIYQFEDKLSEKLCQLDTQAIAAQDGENGYRPGNYFSADIFLYTRCCIVANGRAYFEKVLADPTQLVQDLTFEALLYVAHEAYKRKTGKEMEFLPLYRYETFSNKKSWNKK